MRCGGVFCVRRDTPHTERLFQKKRPDGAIGVKKEERQLARACRSKQKKTMSKGRDDKGERKDRGLPVAGRPRKRKKKVLPRRGSIASEGARRLWTFAPTAGVLGGPRPFFYFKKRKKKGKSPMHDLSAVTDNLKHLLFFQGGDEAKAQRQQPINCA